MSDERLDEPYCDLSMWLLRCWGLKTTYSARTGVERSFSLTGRIRDPIPELPSFSFSPLHGNSHFHYKAVGVEVISPPRRAPCVDHGCGVAWISAGVDSERTPYGGAPVRVTLGLSDEAFDALYSHARRADDDRRLLVATAVLVGPSLPPRHPVFGVRMNDLDVSSEKSYVVRDFNVSDGRCIGHWRDHLLRVPQGRDERDGARIAVRLIEFEIRSEWVAHQSISCQGRVLGWGEPYSEAEVKIEFSEREPDALLEVGPEAAGTFKYWPKSKDEQSAQIGLFLDLRYLRGDGRDILISLLATPSDCEVTLDINLVNETSEFREASDVLKGNVRDYEFKVRRQLASTKS